MSVAEQRRRRIEQSTERPEPGQAEPERVEAELALARISHRLLAVDTDGITGAVREELASTAALAGCDRSALQLLEPDWLGAWQRDGVPDVPPPTDAARHPWLHARLAAGEVVHLTANVPPAAAGPAERAALADRGAVALLAVPMCSGSGLMGIYVLERVRDPRPFSEREIATLRSAGEIFVFALKRWAGECALRESEERFRTITEQATELVAEFDTQGRYCYASPSYEALLGLAPQSLLGRVATELIHPDDLQAAGSTFIRSFTEGVPAYSRHRLRHANGEWRWFENSGRAYRLANGQRRFVSIGHDVTERIDAEHTLERQLELEQTVARLSRRLLGVVEEGLGDEIVAALAETAALARADRGYLARLPRGPGDQGDYYQWCAERLGSPPPRRRAWTESRLAKGETLYFPDVRDLPPEAAAEKASVRARGVESFVSIPVRKGDELVGAIGFESLEPRRWTEHEIRLIGLIGEILTSAIQRHASEKALRESQLELLQSQKLEAVGRLAGGIAHDFNNLLTVILGLARPLLESVEPDSAIASDLNDIHHAAERAAALTRQLLTFSRRQPVERQIVDLNAALEQIRPLLEHMLGEDVALRFDLADEPVWVRGDAHQFEQVLVNLAANARDAMPDGGSLDVRTEPCAIDDETARVLRLPGAGPYVLLAVSDSGEGMDARTRRRVFDPFFTTKEQGKGTGLGLSIVYSVIEQSEGSIEVDTAPGAGSCFRIWLPRAPRRTAARPDVDREPRRGGSERVLFVEDEPAVQRLGRRILEQAGYRVVVAEDGEAALEILEESPDSVDAVVTDVVMPRMGGAELARRARGLRHDLPILFVSGHPGDPGRRCELPEADMLRKPYSAESLLGRLRALLDRD